MQTAKFIIFGLSLAALLLSGCENLLSPPSIDNSGRNLNVSTNAVFVAMHEEGKEWEVRTGGNAGFATSSNSLILDNSKSRFSVIMACPSSNRQRAHRIYFYMGTAGELGEISHLCRKFDGDITRHRAYGSVAGIDVNKGQKARLALGNNRGEWVYEAYAFEDIAGTYDLLGYLAEQRSDGTLLPLRLIKRRNVALDLNPPSKTDVDFSNFTQPLTVISDIPTSAHKVATVNGIPSGANWKSELLFRSEGGSQLTLAEGAVTPLNYFGFPLLSEGGGAPVDLQGDEEGHEFTSKIFDANGQVTSSVSEFFKDPQDVDLTFASTAVTVNGVTAQESDEGISIDAQWDAVSDPIHGNANLYYWIIKGDTANAPYCEECGGIDVNSLEWHVLVTPGWLTANANKLEFNLPPVVEIPGLWSRTWNFSITTSLNWELQTYFSSIDKTTNPTSEDTDLEALLNHLFNREYINGLRFAQITKRSS